MDYIFFILLLLVLVVLVYRLSRRVSALEEKIDRVSVMGASAPVYNASVPPTSSSNLAYQTEPVLASPAPAPTPYAPTWSEQLSAWVKEDFLMKVGGLLIFLGFAWFVSYAFISNWIGPMGRIALGLITGAGILGFGFYRIRQFVNQGSVFVVLGAGVVHLTVFSARVLYDIFSPEAALVVMFLASAFVALTAVKFRVHMLAFIGLILAGIVPLLVHSGVENYIGLFSYLGIVTLGVLWVVFLTQWRDLLVGSLALVSFYSFAYLSGYHRAEMDTMLLFAYAFTVVFFSANIVGFIRAKEATQANIVGAVWNGFFLLWWILAGISKDWQSLVLSVWTVAFLVAAFLLYYITKNAKPFLSYAVVGILFLGVATAAELDGAVLGIAFTLEAAGTVFLTYLLLRNKRITEITSLLFIIPGIFAFNSITRYPEYIDLSRYKSYMYMGAPVQQSLFNEHFFLIVLYSVTLLGFGALIRKSFAVEGSAADTQKANLPTVVTTFGATLVLVLLWLFLHHAFVNKIATLISLSIYTIVGIAAYLSGIEKSSKALRVTGGFLIGFVVLHLFIVDVWQMPLAFRVVTFFVVGALLMGTAFIGRGRKTV